MSYNQRQRSNADGYKDEAANQVDIPDCYCRGCKKTHRQKTRVMACKYMEAVNGNSTNWTVA